MKFVAFLSALIVFATAKELYSTENDNFKIENADAATIKAILDCFIDRGSCDDRSADFKKDITEAVLQACAKCTAAQKHIFKVFLEIIQKQEKEGYQVFQQKYDPQNKYLAPLQAALAQ